MTVRERILIVEDEEDLVEVVSYNLRREGFDVAAAGTGGEGLRRAREDGADLVLLGRSLPDVDGLFVCERLREDPLTARIPIILVTAKSEEGDVVQGLGRGADDYVAKPFSSRELVARVRAVLRRDALRAHAEPPHHVVHGSLAIDAAGHTVTYAGREIALTATEFRLLHFLAANPGRAFRRGQLIRQAVGPHADLQERNIDVHVRAIRRKLGGGSRLVETVRGVGYRFRRDPGGA